MGWDIKHSGSPHERRLATCPGAAIGDMFDPSALGDQLLLSCVFKFNCIALGEASLLGDVHLRVAREGKLGPEQGFSHIVLTLHIGAMRRGT